MKPMRRKRQLLNNSDITTVLRVGTSGVLALLGEDGHPYAVPLSYVYDENRNRIYVHGANEGYKLDCIKHHDKASFCVVNKDEPIINRFDTMFRSVIAFGKIRIIDDESEKRHALTLLGEKFSIPDNPELDAYIKRAWNKVTAMSLDIERITGKESIELVIEKNK